MRVMSSRRLRGLPYPLMFGQEALPVGEEDNIDVQLKPSTAAAGLGFLVLAGVLTHVAVRVVDRWFFK